MVRATTLAVATPTESSIFPAPRMPPATGKLQLCLPVQIAGHMEFVGPVVQPTLGRR